MTDSTRAFFLIPPEVGALGSAGFTGQVGGALHPETPPSILWGQGTPNGDLTPFNLVNKGSLYSVTNNTDDDSHVYMKVDEAGANSDWVKLITSAMTLSIADGVGLTLAGTSTSDTAVWVSTAFFSITNPSDSGVTGYYSALELELTNESATSSAYAPLVLNIVENGTATLSTSAWIHFRDYGTHEPRYLFWIGDVTMGSGSIGNVVMSSGSDQLATHYIRFIAGKAPTITYYLMCTTTDPT